MHLKKMSLGALYDKTGLHPEFMRRIFNGQPTSEQTLKKLAEALDVPPWKAYKQLLEVRQEKQTAVNNLSTSKSTNA